jgi:predicted membrane-bound spermidine synthase
MSILLLMFFISGFTALLYQVVWQRMLGLFSGSDVRSVTIVVASYLLGLGLGSLIGGYISDSLNNRKAVQVYGYCNLGIALFAIFSRFLFYDLLFRQLKPLAQSIPLVLLIVFISLLVPTVLMGLSLPLVAKASSSRIERAAPRIGLLYGINALGSGLGTLISGWYIIGTLGYEQTVYFGAVLSTLVGIVALSTADQFEPDQFEPDQFKPDQVRTDRRTDRPLSVRSSASTSSVSTLASRSSAKAAPQRFSLGRFSLGTLETWGLLVFGSGFIAISLEIIWFRVLDTVLQSIAYTYAHLLAFILIGNAVGSIVGAAVVRQIRNPRQIFLWIQGFVVAYSLLSIWLISICLQQHPTDLVHNIGYLDPDQIGAEVVLKYGFIPLLMLVPPNFLLGFYFPLVQKAVQTDSREVGQRLGLIQVANILGNTSGSLLTGLVLLNFIGTSGSLKLLAIVGLGLVLLSWNQSKAVLPSLLTSGLAAFLTATIILFPNNTRLWASLHGIQPQQYFIAAEDSTGIAGVTEADQRGTLLASGQAQAGFPYMQVHALLGSIPALLHPHPSQIMIIGLGSGGTAHTAGVNPSTQYIRVVELLSAELRVLREYAQRSLGQPLQALFRDPRYEFVVGDGRRELEQSNRQFDIIEADAIYPWRSRAGMLYSQEFFQTVQSHLAPGGMFVEWNVSPGIAPTFRSIFPFVTQLGLGSDLYVLIGSDHPVNFDRATLLTKLNNPNTLAFLANARVNVDAIRRDVQSARVESYSQAHDGKPQPFNTDLFPRSEYYLNRPVS